MAKNVFCRAIIPPLGKVTNNNSMTLNDGQTYFEDLKICESIREADVEKLRVIEKGVHGIRPQFGTNRINDMLTQKSYAESQNSINSASSSKQRPSSRQSQNNRPGSRGSLIQVIESPQKVKSEEKDYVGNRVLQRFLDEADDSESDTNDSDYDIEKLNATLLNQKLNRDINNQNNSLSPNNQNLSPKSKLNKQIQNLNPNSIHFLASIRDSSFRMKDVGTLLLTLHSRPIGDLQDVERYLGSSKSSQQSDSGNSYETQMVIKTLKDIMVNVSRIGNTTTINSTTSSTTSSTATMNQIPTKIARIEHLHVLPSHQSQGVASAIIQYIEAWQWSANLNQNQHQILLQVLANGCEIGFYRKHNFIVVASPEWRDGREMVWMCKKIRGY